VSTEQREVFDYECQACDHQFNDGDEGGPLYECSGCGTSFTREDSADGDSNRCPNCNKFGAKVADLTCPMCQSDEVEHGEFLAPPPPTAEELAERERQAARSAEDTRRHMDEHRSKMQAQADAWEALAGWYDGIYDPDATLEFLDRTFREGSSGSSLPVALADGIAAAILGETAPRMPSILADEFDAAREAQKARWADPAAGFARAFAGIEYHGEDLALVLAREFGGKWASQGYGLNETAFRAIAERLVAAKQGSRVA